MTDLGYNNTTTTSMKGTVRDFQVQPMQTDGISNAGQTFYDSPDFTKYFGYYKKIPELKKAIDALATYTVGKGYETESAQDKAILEHITGAGEDTLDYSIGNGSVIKVI